ncbi:MAG: tetratricopeptide repeat protein [Myxococcota bacterium]
MGLFDFLRPSPEKRIAKARQALAVDDPALARDYLDGLTGNAEADSVRHDAFERLVTRNLEAAVSWAEAGDEERVRVHLELADAHHNGGHEEAFRETRRKLREQRELVRLEEEAKQRAIESKLMDIDPMGMNGGTGALLAPGIEDQVLGSDAEEMRARLALVVENYPADLRGSVTALGADFAQSILDLEEGRPDLALQSLLTLPDDAALVRWERARCAHMLGDHKAAARELRTFANLANGHQNMGRQHSGLLLAQALTEGGDPHGALQVMRDLRAKNPKLGGFLFAQLLFATGSLADADQVLRDLTKQHPMEQAFYKLLAMVRVRGDDRMAAMRALEQGLHQNHCASGTCSARPPDPEVKRMLATLYLEDGLETKRALQLLDEAPVQGGPSWDDLYVQALAAKHSDRSRLPALLETLQRNTPDDDPRAERLQRYLQAS